MAPATAHRGRVVCAGDDSPWPPNDQREILLIALVLLYGVLGVALVVAGGKLGRRAFVLAAAAPLATLVWLATQLDGLLDGEAMTDSLRGCPSWGSTSASGSTPSAP